MKKIKIYLQYPWKYPDSPYYKYLVKDCPNNIEYLSRKKQSGAITNKKKFWFSNILKKNIRKFTTLFNLDIPNAHLSPKGDYDLIHCCHCLSKNLNKPWVADIEMIGSMAISGIRSENGRNEVKKILMRTNCKKIMPWTEVLEKKFLELFPEVKDKVEVVYPAVPVVKNLKRGEHKNLRIIFIARYFDIKGGHIALEVLERLRKKYGTEGIVVADIPTELKYKYPELKTYDLMPQKKLFELMKKSDMFLYPASFDTFGFALIEAMSFGLIPLTICTPNSISRREIIDNERTGLIINLEKNLSSKGIGDFEEKFISDFVEKIGSLITNKNLRKKISRNCLKEIQSGKFSIKQRNEKLKRIYEEAVK